MNSNSKEAVRVTAWAAILGGIFAYLNVGFMLMVTQGDMSVSLDGATMLGFPAETRQFFRLSMLADILGFYLPVLVIGGYLWSVFREEAGTLGDIAVLAIALYVTLGVIGAALQLSVLNPLAEIYAAGGEAAKAAEVVWTSIAVGSQQGLWWCEGPVVLFWGLVVGRHLKRAGWGRLVLLPLSVVGWCFGLFFLAGFFQQLAALSSAMLVLVVLIFPMWMIVFGTRLLRKPACTLVTG